MSVERETFGVMPDGSEVYKYIITNGNETSAHILTLGATLNSFFAEDKNGELRDVVLGFDTVEDYLGLSDYQGATVGPVCNRIGGAAFDIGTKHYELTANENDVTCLHSNGEFSFANWKAIVTDSDSVEFFYVSPDGQNGFPGEVKAKVSFRLDEKDALSIKYSAMSTRETFINLTNHAYFNLDGYSEGDILEQFIRIDADKITAVDEKSIPTGELLDVTGTAFDFRTDKRIGDGIDADEKQLRFTGGYDHNYCINGWDSSLRHCAVVHSEESGIEMNVYTTLPGVQFYAGNFLKGICGKNNVPMSKRGAFCLETQYYPDTPNNPAFPTCLFKAGESYKSETVYAFSHVKEEKTK